MTKNAELELNAKKYSTLAVPLTNTDAFPKESLPCS